ncbi:tetratricopeptide repeat protein, partial [uncultured Porphyromonas sp.]|uniref:tetratricopeptide repeat protein n=1 Tax=uncultured Porphyromonas sp. TaxID=159274 RepID=UPI00260D9BF6
MRRKLLYIISLLSLSLPLFATLFEEGVAAYSDADYPKAIECFNKALEEGEPTAEIYYNLASAYYKNN